MKTLDKYKIPFLIGCVVVTYIMQFVVLPKCFPVYYPTTNESVAFMWIPMIVFLIVVNIIMDVKIGMWALADAVYVILINIYNNGAYGIGSTGLLLDSGDVVYSSGLAFTVSVIIGIVLLVMQSSVRGFKLIIQKSK